MRSAIGQGPKGLDWSRLEGSGIDAPGRDWRGCSGTEWNVMSRTGLDWN